MEFDDQFKLGHLLFSERKCRVCGEVKDLIDGFCSSDDTIRIDNMVIRWKISRRNAAELIANFELFTYV